MIGRRAADGTEPHLYEPGDYGLWQGTWWCRCPLNEKGQAPIGNLANHSVIVNDDATITVSPSILVSKHDAEEMWHGFLERGAWRSC